LVNEADPALTTFRESVRAWLLENCPPEMREPARGDEDICWGGRNPTFSSPAQKHWLEVMGARGWTAPDWPSEYGGGGLSAAETKILREEMAALGCRSPLHSFGISMLGPALLKFGTEEQKLEYLPPIVRGEIRWCQGYSEPGAGSDLVSLATKAEEAFDEKWGDHFVINGQKVWTSYADKADWIFCLVRTNPADKYHGITFLLFDMASPGVSTQPILLISGHSPFCETFFDDVAVPKSQVVGEINRGWDVAKYLLSHEREMISGIGLRGAGEGLPEIALACAGRDADGRLDDPLLRARIARYEVRAAAFRALSERFSDELKAGAAHPAQSSQMKYLGTELAKSRNELTMAALGTQGLVWEGGASNDGAAARGWLRSKGNSIEGGTSEIQLNVVSKRLLGLPET
jgi:acyl-CoA dehydrogenase